MKRHTSAGFTLIELMIVVVIIGIIAAFAYPSYLDTIRKSRRAEAKTALGDAAARLEQYYSDRKTYLLGADGTDLEQLGYVKDGDGLYYTPERYYTVASVSTATTYTLSATPTSKGDQDKDTVCDPIVITHRGSKTPATCW